MPSPTTIVVPCYNESERLDTSAFVAFLAERPWLSFLFVNDGSTDSTGAILTALAAEHGPNVRALLLDVNGGKAEAVRRGTLDALSAGASYVGFWDADLATPLRDIDTFVDVLEQREGVDMVLGSRVQLLGRRIDRDMKRHYFGRLAATVVSNMLRLRVYDTQCGAKLFRAGDACHAVFADPFLTKWVFDVEILARWIGEHPDLTRSDLEARVVEYPLEKWTDVAGSRLKPIDFLKAPAELARIARHYRALL